MMKMLVRFMPMKKYPAWIRYGATSLIITSLFLLRLVIEDVLQGYPLLLFFPGIFLASLVFNRGSGLLATLLSAVLSSYFMEPYGQLWLIRANDAAALLLFTAIGGGIALVTEALRHALEYKYIARSERRKDLLLREINHRIGNDLQGNQ
jgi:K+-sensing histidine kinase KdpD